MEQKFIIEDIKSFEPKHIFECGQCFRWNVQTDGSYIGVVGNAVLNVKKEGNRVIITGKTNEDLNSICKQYFDLDTNYIKIKEKLENIDEHLKLSIKHGNGIRILKQDLWETLISFIISANNNIPRIKIIIERLSERYGKPINWQGKTYYTFPSPEELKNVDMDGLRDTGMGFRDKYVYKTTQMVLEKQVDLKKLKLEKDVIKIRNELTKFPGVGDKVADCIMLFSLQKLEVFPIDVWVRRVMNELYIKSEDEKKVKKEQIRMLARAKI